MTVFAAFATPLAADMALLPDGDYAVQIGEITVRADVAASSSTLSGPNMTPWTIPATPRLIGLSPSGDQVLAIHDGDHIERVEPFLFVATVYKRNGDSFAFRHLWID